MERAAKMVMLTGTGFQSGHLERLAAAGLRPVMASPDELGRIGRDAHGYVLGGDERITTGVLDAMPMLEAISFVGVGLAQFVDCAAARSRGVALMNTPGLMVDAVVEHSLGFLLGLQRGLFRHNEATKRGRIHIGETQALSDSTIGLVGLGRIGLEAARQLREGVATGAELLYWSRSRKMQVETELDIRFACLIEIFERSNSVLLFLAAPPETHGIIGEKLFARIQAPIFLVNTAAAELVAPWALRAALDQGRIAGAAFDGYWQEPLPPPSSDPFGLLAYPDGKFIVTPHVAAKASSAWPRMIDAAVENLVRHFGGGNGT